MSRDRLAEARAAAQNNNANNLEMTSIQNVSASGTSYQATSYLDEISTIKQDIVSFKALITRIGSLNEQGLIVISDKQQQEHSDLADGVTNEAKVLMQTIKNSLKNLLNMKLADPSQDNVRKGQYTTLKKQFMDSISNYQKVEQKHRQQVKARLERQYRIVRPDASEDEIREALDGEGDGPLFAQSVLQSARAGEAKKALKEVQDRHMDIQKIVKSIEELNTLYHEMQYMVEQQDVMVENIDKHVEEANVHLEEANVQIEKATDLAKSSRKKKFFLLFLAIAILAIIGVVIWASLPKSSSSS